METKTRDLSEWWESNPEDVKATIETLRELIREAKRTNHEMSQLLASIQRYDVKKQSLRIDAIERQMENAVINWHGQREDGEW